jgi:hypothetical protein
MGRFGAGHVESQRIVAFEKKFTAGPGFIKTHTYLISAGVISA